MITKKIAINYEGYKGNAFMETLFFNESQEIIVKKRPLILILPGGGYEFLSDREADSIALQFNAKGYHTAIMRYSVKPAVYPTALLEVASAVKYLKENSEEYGIDPEKIVLYGASAGGHAAAMFGTGWYRPEVSDVLKTSGDDLKIAGLILAYPVITSGEYAHRGSFDALLGDKKDDKGLLDYVSIENRVTDKTPASFVWHTFTDGSVPVENSFMYASAMKKANVPIELHIFPTGGHGLALANEMTLSPWKKEIDEGSAQWIDLCNSWLSRLFGPLC